MRARDEASRQMKDVANRTEGLSRGFQGLGRSMAAVGLGSIGLGVGVRLIAGEMVEARQHIEQTNFIIATIGPAAQKAFDEMAPHFDAIADKAGTISRDVEEAWAAMIQASGGVAPSVEQVQAAFDLAKTMGVDAETAARAIGSAMIGDLEPLRQLSGDVVGHISSR